MLNVCYLGHIAQTCTAVLYRSTSSSIKKLKASYNGGLRRLLLIVKPYSAREMFVTHNIPSFYKLVRKCIYSFRERIAHSANKIIKAGLSPIVFICSPIRQWYIIISLFADSETMIVSIEHSKTHTITERCCCIKIM